MVSFVCDYCQDTVKKPKLEQHRSRCRQAQFSCIDCSVSFQGQEYKWHTSCISEAEKYQGSTYVAKSTNGSSKTTAALKATTTTTTDASLKNTTANATTDANAKKSSNFAKALPSISIQDQINAKSTSNSSSTTASTTSTTATTSAAAAETKKDTTSSNLKTRNKIIKMMKKQLKKKEKENRSVHDFLEKCWTKWEDKHDKKNAQLDRHEFTRTVLESLDGSCLSILA